jgi:DNA-binding XRE family transcriptional regulator
LYQIVVLQSTENAADVLTYGQRLCRVRLGTAAMLINHLKEWRARRGKRGIKKADLARHLGVDRAFVTRLEQGKARPSLELALRIAQYFGCPVEAIFELGPEADGTA